MECKYNRKGARIYGTGALYVALHNIAEDKDDFDTKPNFYNAKDFDIRFNVLDPQNIAGSTVDTNPISFHFLELINIKVDNQLVPRKRVAISHALEPLYLDNRTSLIPYSPPSVFYNMIDLLEDYDKAIQGLDALLYKSGCFIYQFPSKSKISGATYDAIKTSNYILEQKSNGSVISIQKDADIKDFPLSNINGLIEAVNKLEDAITKALNDTPASILFDRQLSNGFSNGDKDKETEIQIVNTFRQNKIKPLYELTDYYVMLKAWNEDFINEIKEKYTNLSEYSNIQLFKKWQDDFVFEFGNLYPEPESITIENNAKKLDNLLKLQQLGANAADIEAELNEDEIFKNEMDLDGQQPDFDDDDIDDASAKIDMNMLRIDDAKKEFDESKIKRDKDGRFAKKNESGDGNKDNKDTDNKGTDDNGTDDIDNSKDKKQKDTKNKDTKKAKNNKTKDKNNAKKQNKSNNGLDYGDLPAELHEPFKRLNTATKPAEYIFNNDNEQGLTIDDVIKISNNYKDPVDTTFCKISKFELRDEDGEYIYNDDGDIETVDLTNRDALKNDVEKFLYDFTCNSDKAKAEWGERWENEIKPQLKQMIKNSPVMKGKAYRVETFDGRREDIVEGGKINFDCRSVADDNKGYETVCNFSHEDYENGEEIIIFEFPEDTRGLNIQGCSVYPNEHEYLVDGDFIMEEVYKDEFDITVVKLVKADS